MKQRRGYSLVELLVVMAAASTVLTLSAMLIHRTMRLASQTRSFHAEEATAWRLSSQLRRDAAGAVAIDLEVTGAELTVAIHDSEAEPIVYRFLGAQVERSQRLEGDRVARDAFVLSSVADWVADEFEGFEAVRIEAMPSRLPIQSLAPVPVRLVVRAGGESTP